MILNLMNTIVDFNSNEYKWIIKDGSSVKYKKCFWIYCFYII